MVGLSYIFYDFRHMIYTQVRLDDSQDAGSFCMNYVDVLINLNVKDYIRLFEWQLTVKNGFQILANILFPRSITQNRLIATQIPATRYRFILAALSPKRLIK